MCLLTWLLGGCGMQVPGIYRIDIQQGNVLTQEQLAKLEYGMEKRKVRFVLGTPLLTDAFNQDRWDYYYSYEKGGGEKVQRRVSVFFEEERLVRLSGDVTPAAGPIQLPPRQEQLVNVPEGYNDRGLLSGLMPDFMSGKPKRIKPKEPEESEEKTGGDDREATQAAAAAEPTAESGVETSAGEDAPTAAAVDISETETEALSGLLSGFGQRQVDAPLPATAEETETEEARKEGLFTRWARRLGLGDDETTAPASPSPPPEPPPAPEN